MCRIASSLADTCLSRLGPRHCQRWVVSVLVAQSTLYCAGGPAAFAFSSAGAFAQKRLNSRPIRRRQRQEFASPTI
jgi:hypothetical protein